jgi:prolyl-tRNA synthetase
MEKKEVKAVIRHVKMDPDAAKKEKFQLSWENIGETTAKLLEQIHHDMYNKAVAARAAHISEADNFDDFMAALNKKDIVLTPWCDIKSCEEKIKDHSKEVSEKLMAEANEGEAVLTGSAKTLCIPYEMGNQKPDCKCFYCSEPAKVTALWGRTY